MHAPRHTASRLAAALAAAALLSCGGGGGGGGGSGSGGYQIQLQFETSLTDAQRAAFVAAANRIGKIVTTGLSTVSFDSSSCKDQGGTCTCGSQYGEQYPVPATVKNLLIFVEVKAIDGAGMVLGSSGPCYVRGAPSSTPDLPVVGIMTFDSADLANLETSGRLDAVILHEMLHVVGFGTVWQDKGVLALDTCSVDSSNHVTCPTGADPGFSGTGAIAAFHRSNGGTAATVPVEATGGDGTALSHWRETVFGKELMTGWITGSSQPLSATTIGSLADLGYQVDLSRADAFNLSTAFSLQAPETGAAEGPAVFVGNDTLGRRPVAMPDAAP
jgi:hypothetical protein